MTTDAMTDILAEIQAHKRYEVDQSRREMPLDRIKALAADTPKPRDFFSAVTRPKGELRVIAEIKKASPSAGLIRSDFDPESLACAYHANGAAAISCLTDRKYFQGSLDYISRTKHVTPLPVLRKDFIIDPYQLYQARAADADAVLLIAECLADDAQLTDMVALAVELQLAVLLEVHGKENLLRVKPHVAGAHRGRVLLGINNRDLTTMTTDLAHTLCLLDMVDDVDVLVSESGIKTAQDIARLQRSNVNRILVGEHLMRQPDPGAALAYLTGTPASS